MTSTPLVTALEAHAPELVEQVHQQMWRNPFWRERFPARGEKFSREDGHFHLAYLKQALLADAPSIFVEYGRWLRAVLASRGICTLHLAETFERFAGAIEARRLPGGARAVEILRAGTEGLVYPDGPARELQLQLPILVQRTLGVLEARHPEWVARWGEAGRVRCAQDLGYHLSYLGDALVLQDPAAFPGYLGFIAGFLARRQLPVEHLIETLEALGEQLAGVTAGTRERASELLARGLKQLRSGVPG